MAKVLLFLMIGLLATEHYPCCVGQMSLATVAHAKTPPSRDPLRVVIPGEVKGQWKSVEISILDQEISSETTYTINIGETFQVPGSTLKLRVDTFLPAFIMKGSQMTSASNEPKNPAAYVVIEENGEDVFSGWLFSLFPDACAVKNPRYSFNLAGYNKIP
ncbi:MAG: DUF2155 domain-containing protein [Desulfuromonas sp.]|nr:MAG: DUF2155 domain-containing protein [Desulfuromonas sp.]